MISAPSLEVLQRLVKALDVTVGELLGETAASKRRRGKWLRRKRRAGHLDRPGL